MKKFSWVLLVLMTVGVGLFVAGCSSNRMGDNNGAKMTSSDLKDAIEGKFKSDPDLRAADLSVSADVDDNEVEISGKVESEALRAKAIDLAKSAHPGIIVTDKIDVTPRELGRSDDMGIGDRDRDNGRDSGLGTGTSDQDRNNNQNRHDDSSSGRGSSPSSPRR